MSSHKTFELLTPSACFTIACLAFSVVAISAVWRNTSQLPVEQERTVQASAGPNFHHWQADRVLALCARIAHGLQHDQKAPDLVGELSLLMALLCRLQHDLSGGSIVKQHLDDSISRSLVLLEAHLSTLENCLSSGHWSDATFRKATQQIKDQRVILDMLLPDAYVMSNTSDSIPGLASVETAIAACSERQPVVSENRWTEEPPPEYSPPAKESALSFSEKSKDVVTPMAEVDAPESEDASGKCNDVYRAVTGNHSIALARLLASGANHSAYFGELKRTPLHQAAHLNHCDCLSILLRHGAELSAEDAKGDTALHLAAWSGNVEALTALLSFGAQVDWISGRDGYSPLWCAVSAFQIDAAKVLLKHGAGVDLRSGSLTPLHQAAVTDQDGMCKLLLDWGAEVNCIDDEKSTPLHYAAASGSTSAVAVLIRGGADVEARQIHGLTPAHWAAHKGHSGLLGVLLDHGSKLESKTGSGATPLHLAANRGRLDAVRVLIERGASCRVASASWDGIEGTPQQMAMLRGHIEVAELLRF